MVSLPPGTIRNYNAQLQNESPFLFTILNLTNTLTNLCLGAVAIIAFVYANTISTPKSLVISQHIYLCVFGVQSHTTGDGESYAWNIPDGQMKNEYVILMVQAILSINIHTGWARAFSCSNKRALHYILQIIGSILGLVGCLRMMLNQVRKPHQLRTIHGILGIVTMSLTILSLIGGVVNLNSSKFNIKQNLIKITHSTLGCLTILFAFLAMIFAFNEHMNVKQFGSTNVTLFIALVIMSLILTLSSPIRNVRRLLA